MGVDRPLPRLKKYTLKLPVRLACGVRTSRVRQTGWRALKDELLAFEEVEYFAFITGSFDALLIVRVPDMRHLRDVVLERLQALPEVRSTQTSFVLEEVIRRPYVLPPNP